MIVHKSKRVLVTVEMSEEQSDNLCTALGKVNKDPKTSGQWSHTKEEAEVMNDLRQSLLNS